MTMENPQNTDTFGDVLDGKRRIYITLQTTAGTYKVLVRRTTPSGIENGLGPYFFEIENEENNGDVYEDVSESFTIGDLKDYLSSHKTETNRAFGKRRRRRLQQPQEPQEPQRL